MNDISLQIKYIQQQIELAKQAAGRQTDQVTLLAVSKTKPLEAIKAAYLAGHRQFGENYVQEGIDKIQAAQSSDWLDDPIEWHFIGPLQSNKTRQVAEHFDWVQSIDRLKIAQRLSDQRPSYLKPLNVCLQVNISQEVSKSGVSLTELFALAKAIRDLPNITLRGLMAIPQKANDNNELQQQFNALYEAFVNLKKDYSQVDTLSMGMTADMEQAISNGSTMVRIGTAIFGARDYSTKDH